MDFPGLRDKYKFKMRKGGCYERENRNSLLLYKSSRSDTIIFNLSLLIFNFLFRNTEQDQKIPGNLLRPAHQEGREIFNTDRQRIFIHHIFRIVMGEGGPLLFIPGTQFQEKPRAYLLVS